MKRRIKRGYRRFKRYMERTIANKIIAVILLAFGIIPYLIIKDVTFLIFMSMFAIPLIFATEDETTDMF